ncbi:MAG: hypothetical protein IJZ26_00280 [Clostridia bacterium]|nr:hypothetical protein [Clostridia bacterium]
MAITLTQDLNINNFFEKSKNIIIFKDGKSKLYKQNTQEYKNIMEKFMQQVNYSYEMPAFGVSLHNETVKAMKSGVWIRFDFETEQQHNGMPFNSLLINITQDMYGFNVIRMQGKEYDGRCFYLNLEDNMNNFYDYLNSEFKK